MAYTKQSWTDGTSSGTAITATKLNHIETGIKNAHDLIEGYQLSGVTFTPNTALNNYSSYGNASYQNDEWVTLQCMVYLSTGTTWSADNVRLGQVSTSARPSAERSIYRCCFIIAENGIVSTRSVRVTTAGNVYTDVGTIATINNVQLAIIPGITYRK